MLFIRILCSIFTSFSNNLRNYGTTAQKELTAIGASVSKLVQKVKGVTSRKLLQESRRLQKEFWGKHLWARGYFAVTTGNVTDDIIAEYIKNQDELERRKSSDNFLVGF